MLERLADEHLDVRVIERRDGGDVLVAAIDQLDETLPESRLDFADVFAVHGAHGERAFFAVQFHLVASGHPGRDLHFGPHQRGDASLAGLFDEHLGGQFLASGPCGRSFAQRSQAGQVLLCD